MRWASVSVCVVLLWVNHRAHGGKSVLRCRAAFTEDKNINNGMCDLECRSMDGTIKVTSFQLDCEDCECKKESEWEHEGVTCTDSATEQDYCSIRVRKGWCQSDDEEIFTDMVDKCRYSCSLCDEVGWNQKCGQRGPLCGSGLKCWQRRCQCTDPSTPYWDEGVQACKDTPPPGYVAYYNQQCAAPPTGPACSHTMTCEHKGTKSVCKCSEEGHIYNTVAEMCIPRLGLDLGGECQVLGRGDVPCKQELYCRARFCQCKKWDMGHLIFNIRDGHQPHLYLNERDRDRPEKCKDERGVACNHVDLKSPQWGDVRLREYHIGYRAKQIISLARHNRETEFQNSERSEGQKACKRNETFGWNCTVTLWVSGGCSDVFTVCYIMAATTSDTDATTSDTDGCLNAATTSDTDATTSDTDGCLNGEHMFLGKCRPKDSIMAFIALFVIFPLLIIILCIVLIWCCMRRRRKKKEKEEKNKEENKQDKRPEGEPAQTEANAGDQAHLESETAPASVAPSLAPSLAPTVAPSHATVGGSKRPSARPSVAIVRH